MCVPWYQRLCDKHVDEGAHVAVSEHSVHNYCVPRTVIWTWRFIFSRQT